MYLSHTGHFRKPSSQTFCPLGITKVLIVCICIMVKKMEVQVQWVQAEKSHYDVLTGSKEFDCQTNRKKNHMQRIIMQMTLTLFNFHFLR